MRRTLLLALLLAACGRTRDAERAGDADYAAGRWAEAARHYARAAGDRADARVLAKLGQASFRASDFATAAGAWRRLGEEDASRREEAADGLELVVRGAERLGDAAAVREARAALGALAPERRLASLEAGSDPLVAALAAPDGQRAVDSLLVAWARRTEDEGDCDAAVGAYRAAVRRAEPAFVAPARVGVARCATALGRRALEEGRAGEAAAWFREALAADPEAAGDDALAGLARASAAEQDTTGGAATDSTGAPRGATKE